MNPCPTIFDLTLDSRAAEEEVSEFEGNLQIQEPRSENRVDDGPSLDVHEYMDCNGVETSVSEFEGNLQIPKPNENQLHEIPTLQSKENLTRQTLIEMDVHESTRENATPVFEEDISANTHTPSNGQHLKFFDTIEILNKLLECTEILSGIYKGVKSNTWFVFDNSENIQKKKNYTVERWTFGTIAVSGIQKQLLIKQVILSKTHLAIWNHALKMGFVWKRNKKKIHPVRTTTN